MDEPEEEDRVSLVSAKEERDLQVRPGTDVCGAGEGGWTWSVS